MPRPIKYLKFKFLQMHRLYLSIPIQTRKSHRNPSDKTQEENTLKLSSMHEQNSNKEDNCVTTV